MLTLNYPQLMRFRGQSLFFFFCILTVVSSIIPPPKDSYILIPRTCVYVTIHCKKDFADVIKVKDLEEGRTAWRIQVGTI